MEALLVRGAAALPAVVPGGRRLASGCDTPGRPGGEVADAVHTAERRGEGTAEGGRGGGPRPDLKLVQLHDASVFLHSWETFLHFHRVQFCSLRNAHEKRALA